ncbi:surface protein/Bartonella adhesin [Xanthomonas citri pv. glycines str. 8ra]|uniref:YadA family autotransporter adhesin n=1 Tax=Xanthomonas citri TaxID=346 RepID=UPI00044F2259|nr:hypothetical protein [Xanthomonas citri]EWC50296.1 surface protein/Bartonella adhesin [Xanthomonas citri pv. glycines str. 8ra]
MIDQISLRLDVALDAGAALGAVDSQLTSVNSGLTSVNSGLADVVSGTTGVVQRGDSATAKDTVVLTSSSGSAAKPGAAQKLSNLAVGSVDSGSTDAITGGQLYTQQQRVDSYLGGGADVAAGTTPSYTIQKSAYKSVDTAFGAVDKNLTALNESVVSGTTGVVQRGDSATAKDTVVLTSSSGSAASPGAAQKLSNLAAGSVASTSTDAITGGQLYTQQQRVDSYLGGKADVATGTAPSYTIQKSAYNSVGTALDAVDTNLTTLNESVVSGTTGVVQRGDSATAKDTVVLTSSSGSAASPGTAQKLSNLAAGSVASTSTDAITGGQLYTQQQSVNSYLGGGANIASNIAPSYTIQKKVYSDVGSAFTALDNKLTDLSGSVISGGGGVVQRAEASNTLVLTESGGSVADPGSTQRLSNLSAGAVSASSTDAINGAQLFAINQQLSETNESLLAMQDGLASVTASVAEISIGAGGGSVSGQGANADGAGAAAYGDNSNASGADATAIGENTIASGDQSTASGSGAQATGDKASAYGESSVASGDSSSAIGAGAIASGANATAIGAGSNASADNSVALGAGSVADRENTVSVGSASGARQITNVAAGT